MKKLLTSTLILISCYCSYGQKKDITIALPANTIPFVTLKDLNDVLNNLSPNISKTNWDMVSQSFQLVVLQALKRKKTKK